MEVVESGHNIHPIGTFCHDNNGMEGGALWSIVFYCSCNNETEERQWNENNEIEENNNETEYLFYFNETEYLFSFCQLTYRITDNNGMEERCSLIYCSDNNETEGGIIVSIVPMTMKWRKWQWNGVFTQLCQYLPYRITTPNPKTMKWRK